VSLPLGGMAFDRPAKRYVFVTGGIGVTPFLSAAHHLRRIGHPDFKLHLVMRRETPLSEQLAPLVRDGHVVLHRTSETGRPDIGVLLPPPEADTLIGCCGPQSMIDDFEQAAAGWPATNVHVECFTPPPLAIDPNAKPYTLLLARSQQEIPVRAGQSMLAALEEGGIEIPSSCCGGICGACKVGWIEGKPQHRDRILSPYERERYLMVCVAGSDSERLVLDI
jgi:ferredoxin-NADP reductase